MHKSRESGAQKPGSSTKGDKDSTVELCHDLGEPWGAAFELRSGEQVSEEERMQACVGRVGSVPCGLQGRDLGKGVG